MPEPRNYILSIIGRMENLFVWFKESFGRVYYLSIFSSVQFSRSLMSNSLQPHRLQRTRLPCLSPTPGACSNSCPLSQWCHPTISSPLVPFSSCLQYLPASGDIRDAYSIPGAGRSPGKGNGNPLQYSCLVNSVDRGSWWATVHRVTESYMTEQPTLFWK